MFPAGRRFIGQFGQAGKDGLFKVRFILRRFIGQVGKGSLFRAMFRPSPFYRAVQTGKNVGNAVLHSATPRFNNRRVVFAKKARLYQGFSRGGKAGVPARQQNFRFFRRQRSGKQVALDNIASQIAQNFKILFIFNAFCQYG